MDDRQCALSVLAASLRSLDELVSHPLHVELQEHYTDVHYHHGGEAHLFAMGQW